MIKFGNEEVKSDQQFKLGKLKTEQLDSDMQAKGFRAYSEDTNTEEKTNEALNTTQAMKARVSPKNIRKDRPKPKPKPKSPKSAVIPKKKPISTVIRKKTQK